MKSYIIRLPSNQFSCDMADKCIDQAQKFNLKIEKFDGIDGKQADEIFKRDKISQYPRKLKKNSEGVRGCAGSHYLLWKKCVDDGVPYLILEHDAYMIRPLPDVLEKFDEILKLDSCNPFSYEYDTQVNVIKDDAVIPYDTSWGYKEKKAPYGAYFLGLWAYIIKPTAAEKLLNAIKINGWVPADKQIGVQLLNLNATSNTIFRIHPQYNADNIHQMSLTRKK